MRKHISFAIAGAIVALAMIFWGKASMLESNENVVRPKVDLSSPAANPYLPVRTLDPIY